MKCQWVAYNGTIFETKEECEKYENGTDWEDLGNYPGLVFLDYEGNVINLDCEERMDEEVYFIVVKSLGAFVELNYFLDLHNHISLPEPVPDEYPRAFFFDQVRDWVDITPELPAMKAILEIISPAQG